MSDHECGEFDRGYNQGWCDALGLVMRAMGWTANTLSGVRPKDIDAIRKEFNHAVESGQHFPPQGSPRHDHP